jgi:hypothetical protein
MTSRVRTTSVATPEQTQNFLANENVWEKRAERLHRFALHYIADSINQSIAKLIRVFTTACTPKQFGNQDSLWLEIAKRIFTVIMVILCLPLHLVHFGIGSALDQLGNACAKKPYLYLQGSSHLEEVPNEQEKKFSVLSANVCMLPYGIEAFAGIRPSDARIEELAIAILESNKDFLCLQEMSTPDALKLWEKIKHAYAHGFTRIGPMPFTRMEQGLFFASKHPILEAKYYPLSNAGWIARGVFCVKVAAANILTTHLNAGSLQEICDLRKKQVGEIAALCKELEEKEGKPSILCMDANITRTGSIEDEYSLSGLPKYFESDLSKEGPFTLEEKTATCTNELGMQIQGKPLPEKVQQRLEHIDYILCYKGAKNVASIQTQFVDTYACGEKALSDHKMLEAEITLS